MRLIPYNDDHLDVIDEWPTINDVPRLTAEIRRLNARVAELEGKLNGTKAEEANGNM